MKNGKSLAIVFVLSLSGCFILSGMDSSLAAEKVIKWKCQSHWPAASPSYSASLLKIIQTVKERTKGRLVIEAFPAGSLIPAKEIFHAAKRGMIEMGGTSAAYFRDQIPMAGVAAGLPFSFKDYWEGAYFFKQRGYDKMLKDFAFEKHGLYYFTDRIYPHELVVKKPIRTMEDFKGMKFRSAGVIQIFLTSIGAAASYLPGPEIYPALASGVVDGAHWGAAQGANDMKFYDMCKYHLKPPMAISGTDVYVINKKAFESLPKDIQETFNQVLEEHFWRRTNEYIYLEATVLAKAQKEKGVKVLTLPPEDQKKMTQAAVKIWDKEAEKDPLYAKAIGMMKDFLKELGHL